MVDTSRYSLRRLHQLDAGRCWLCGQRCPLKAATRDHVIPHSLGGAYNWKNFALAHKRCNHDRADRFPAVGFRGMSIADQQQAWDRSGGRCETCGYHRALVLHLCLLDDAAGRHRDRVQILCAMCSDRATARVPSTPLTVQTGALLPSEQWQRLREACLSAPTLLPRQRREAALEAVGATVPDLEPATVLVSLCAAPEAVIEPVTPIPVEARPAPRFTPADMARQLAAAKARQQARAAALEAERIEAERLAQLAACRPSWIRRILGALVWWRRTDRCRDR